MDSDSINVNLPKSSTIIECIQHHCGMKVCFWIAYRNWCMSQPLAEMWKTGKLSICQRRLATTKELFLLCRVMIEYLLFFCGFFWGGGGGAESCSSGRQRNRWKFAWHYKKCLWREKTLLLSSTVSCFEKNDMEISLFSVSSGLELAVEILDC